MSGGINDAVAVYYDTTIDLYEQLWGEHVHHGFWDAGERPGEAGADRHSAADRLVRELVDFSGLPRGARLLDVGCGIGGPAIHLARDLGCTVEGVTLSAAQAQRATERAAEHGVADRTRFHQVDFLDSAYPDATFDAVWALESVMHIADRAAFFAEAWRVLRPGGVLAVASWCVRDGALTADEEALHQQVLRHQVMPPLQSIEEHVRLAAAAGFDEVRSVDWTDAVANSWDPDFALVDLDNGRAFVRELARDRGVDVLGFFYAGPVMLKAFRTGVMTYGAVRAVRPL
jgi:tocopherol O-methyltransferase